MKLLDNEIITIFNTMLDIRNFEKSCIEGSKTGEIHGELHTGIGQEAVGAMIKQFCRKEDALVSTHRNHVHAIGKSVSMRELMAEIFEKETGICKGRGGHMHPFDQSNNFSATGIVGSSIPVALGYAYGFWYENNDNISIAITGDGGSNSGAFHECLNIASAWQLPLLILLENNGYGISVKSENVNGPIEFYQRCNAYGILGKKVDGTNPELLYPVFNEVIEHLRKGNGPAILEVTCARFRGHYEGDHDTYRSRKELDENINTKDPIKILKNTIIERNILSENDLNHLIDESVLKIKNILSEVRKDSSPKSESFKEFVYN